MNEKMTSATDDIVNAMDSTTDLNLHLMEEGHKVQKRALEMQREKALLCAGLLSREEYLFVKYAAPIALLIFALFALVFSIDTFFVKEFVASSIYLGEAILGATVVYLILSDKLSSIEVGSILKAKGEQVFEKNK